MWRYGDFRIELIDVSTQRSNKAMTIHLKWFQSDIAQMPKMNFEYLRQANTIHLIFFVQFQNTPEEKLEKCKYVLQPRISGKGFILMKSSRNKAK